MMQMRPFVPCGHNFSFQESIFEEADICFVKLDSNQFLCFIHDVDHHFLLFRSFCGIEMPKRKSPYFASTRAVEMQQHVDVDKKLPSPMDL